MKGIAKLLVAFGDELDQKLFKNKLGSCSIKETARNASERANGSLGYEEAMMSIYNKRMRYPLHHGKLYNKKHIIAPDFMDKEDSNCNIDENIADL